MNEWETCIAEWATRCHEKDATIAALQAQLKEQSEKLKYHDLFKQWQCWRDPDELVDEYEKWQAAIQEHQSLKDQLTQRTAELEAVSNFIGVKYDAESKTWVSGQSPYLSAGTTKQEACIAAIDALRLVCDTWETKYRDLQAELERVRGERDRWQSKYDVAQMNVKNWQDKYEYLLQHRQGMEG